MQPTVDSTRRRWRSIGARTCLLAIVATVLGAACTSLLAIKDPTLDDAGGGGGSDAAIDAAVDSAIDGTPIDSAIDGPPAVCTTGACCSPAGQFEPATKVCSTTTEFQCSGSCGGQPQSRMVQTSCSGTSAACDGTVVRGSFTNTGTSCSTDQICEPQGTAAPRCTSCGFGCNPTANACRPAKVFLLGTAGGFQGGGTAATSVGGRAGADVKCATDFSNRFAALACNASHAHAVLTASASDTVGAMAVTFGIPTTVPVHRADDDALIVGTWNDFIDPNKILTNPATPNTVTPANRLVWTGANGVDTCAGWTSTGANGVRGDTAQTSALRLSNDVLACNFTAHLLCVCWSGP
jgi:hypothetical protein